MAAGALREVEAYWQELQQLKARVIYTRLYRNRLARWVRAVDLVKAVASSGAIAAWVVWREFPLVWASIIAASQFLDAIKSVFPFAKLHKAAAAQTVAIETIWIDAEAEWSAIYAGQVDGETIPSRLARLRKLQLASEARNFPDGFEPGRRLMKLAERDANAYFAVTEGLSDD